MYPSDNMLPNYLIVIWTKIYQALGPGFEPPQPAEKPTSPSTVSSVARLAIRIYSHCIAAQTKMTKSARRERKKAGRLSRWTVRSLVSGHRLSTRNAKRSILLSSIALPLEVGSLRISARAWSSPCPDYNSTSTTAFAKPRVGACSHPT